MFDLELDEVPGAHAWSKSHNYWFDGMYEWSKSKLHHIPVAITDDTLDDLFHIAMIETGEGKTHAVIAYGQTIVWNPTPNHEVKDLSKLTYSLIFVNYNGLSVQNACRMSYINDWMDEAHTEMYHSIIKDIKHGQ
jgi:hypothetical protein